MMLPFESPCSRSSRRGKIRGRRRRRRRRGGSSNRWRRTRTDESGKRR